MMMVMVDLKMLLLLLRRAVMMVTFDPISSAKMPSVQGSLHNVLLGLQIGVILVCLELKETALIRIQFCYTLFLQPTFFLCLVSCLLFRVALLVASNSNVLQSTGAVIMKRYAIGFLNGSRSPPSATRSVVQGKTRPTSESMERHHCPSCVGETRRPCPLKLCSRH
ncbi:MAG: hypothetical protein J3Q66DRAFT_322000 [Benniella sp.]|nr:MAG: hypothetical protein J3Q66DRAFT_322000 [Benniella sp.]